MLTKWLQAAASKSIENKVTATRSIYYLQCGNVGASVAVVLFVVIVIANKIVVVISIEILLVLRSRCLHRHRYHTTLYLIMECRLQLSNQSGPIYLYPITSSLPSGISHGYASGTREALWKIPFLWRLFNISILLCDLHFTRCFIAIDCFIRVWRTMRKAILWNGAKMNNNIVNCWSEKIKRISSFVIVMSHYSKMYSP